MTDRETNTLASHGLEEPAKKRKLIQKSLSLSDTLASRGLEEPAHASRGLEEPFLQLCCCVSFLFWREIGFGCTYYYVLGVPYSCGVVLVILVLAGNSFWCYVRT